MCVGLSIDADVLTECNVMLPETDSLTVRWMTAYNDCVTVSALPA